jgi:CRISP-associated protein Cas1
MPEPTPIPTHPTDLVVDLFGTFLGRRSERLLVRWRESAHERVAARGGRGPRVLRFPGAGGQVDGVADKGVGESGDPGPHPADIAAERLLTLWNGDDEQATRPTESPAERLRRRLDEIARGGDDQQDEAVTPVANDPVHGDSIHDDSNANRSANGDADARDHAGIGPGTTKRGDWHERGVPFSRLRSVTVAGRGITISSDLIAALIERGIGLSFLGGRGEPVAHLSSPGLGGTVLTRRSQLAAYDSPLGVELAVAFVRGKLRNQKHQLQYSGKYLKGADPERFARLQRKIAALANVRRRLANFKGPNLVAVRDSLMGYEGTGGRVYWEGVAILLAGRIDFPGRRTRGAIDPVNAALNYGYGILYSQVSAAILNAGLEMFAGFLHVDRPGKPSLVLDLVEEFRAPVVDRVVLALVNQGVAIETDEHGLRPRARRLIADRILERLATLVPYEGKRWPISNVIQNQARHLAVAVRGERTYRPFASRW